MKHEQEDNIVKLFASNRIRGNWQHERPKDLDLWPDGIIRADNYLYAIEISECVDDRIPEQRKRKIVAEKEKELREKVQVEINNKYPTIGGIINYEIDLDIPRITSNRINKISSILVEQTQIENFEELEERRNINSTISELNVRFSGIVGTKWNTIIINVGYKGSRVPNLTNREIQGYINKKDECIIHDSTYDEKYLILVEGLDGSLRDNIDKESQYDTKYDKVFIYRELDNEFIELKTITNTPHHATA